MYSHVFKRQKSHANKTNCKMLVLLLEQDGPLVFGVSLILYGYRKMDRTHRNCLQSTYNFSIYDSTYRESKSTIRKSLKFWPRINIKILSLVCSI